MTKKSLAGLLVVGLVAVTACGRGGESPETAGRLTAAPSVSPSPSPTSALIPTPAPTPTLASSADVTALAMSYTEALVRIGPRVKGQIGESQAADYIETTLRDAGLEVSRQPFDLAAKGRSANVIARLPSVDYSAGYVILGAHYDTVPGTVGANDNASGTAMLMALAQKQKDYLISMSAPIEFVAFGAEEIDPTSKQHHEGSHFYRDNTDLTKIKAMISIDMIANGEKLKVVFDRRAPGSLYTELVDVASAAGVPAVAQGAGDVSDHTSFTRRGVPGALLWSGRHPSFHTRSDDLSVVQPEALDRCAKVVIGWFQRSPFKVGG